MHFNIMGLAIKRRYEFLWEQRVSGITFIRYAQSRKIGKPNNIKFFKESKQDSQNRLRSPMSERRTLVLSIITLLRNFKFQ